MAQRRSAATQIEELMEPYRPPEILSRVQIAKIITPVAEDKARRYHGRGIGCEDLDLLVYVNRSANLNPDTPAPPLDLFLRSGWRSVSVLIPPHAYVIHASAGAPLFIQQIAGNPTNLWPLPLGLFEL